MKLKQMAAAGTDSKGRGKAAPQTDTRQKQTAQPVLFEYHDAGAHKVCIAGSFNEWRPDGLEMVNLSDGKWVKNLLLPPGAYEYRLIVDGQWICDPKAHSTVPNPFGDLNSVVQVVDSSFTSSSTGSDQKRTSTARSRPVSVQAHS